MSAIDRLDAIEARANAATEGPWRAATVARYTNDDGQVCAKGGIYPGGPMGPGPIFLTIEWLVDDAEFIAHARADVPALVAALRAVLDLHKPRTVQGITGDCAAEMCDHEEECPTVPFEECVECDRLAEEIDAYYEETNLAPTAWPCATTLAIEGALT